MFLEGEEGMHKCQGWLFHVLAKATVEDDANPDRRMRRRRNLRGKDNEFGFGPVQKMNLKCLCRKSRGEHPGCRKYGSRAQEGAQG